MSNAMSITANVTFDDRTQEALVKMDNVTDKETKRIAEQMTNLAKAIAPVDTSRLKDNIWWDNVRAGECKVFTQTAHDGEPGYGFWVEVGTAIMAAQEYLRPALRRAAEIVFKKERGLGWLTMYQGRGARRRKKSAMGKRGKLGPKS